MRGAIHAVVSGTAAAFDRTTGVRVAVGSGLRVNHRSVARAAGAEMLPCDGARRRGALRNADDVHAITGFELGDGNGLPGFDAVDVVAEFARPAARFGAGLLIMSGHCTVHARLLDIAESERDSFIAVAVRGSAFHHGA